MDTKISRVKVKVKMTESMSNPTAFMETQAWRGSYSLMMPYDYMQKLIRKLYSDAAASARKNGFYYHDGFRYEYVGRKIAETYNLSKARVKSRMLLQADDSDRRIEHLNRGWRKTSLVFFYLCIGH